MKPHYYYKAEKESEAGKGLQEFTDKCVEVSERARLWALAQGATGYIESQMGMAGGISAVEFENTLSKEGWERVEAPDGSVYFVPEPDSETEKEMFALPVVSEGEIINILRFKPRMSKSGKPLPVTFGNTTPVFFMYEDYWYMDMPYECEAEGVESITKGEFEEARNSFV